jgi:LPS sulfotransferase NodH
MSIASSPLRDRVIFIEGAPRSGTTWLLTLVATHPDIAGSRESHLFNFGVDRLFDNFEVRVHPPLPRLQGWLERDQFIDIIRDLCDALFMAMRERVSGGTQPALVVEKTPVDTRTGPRDLARKREVYPDAWYLHVIRDREAVAKSLMRAPWIEDRSHAACSKMWDDAVGQVREAFGGLDRYRELSYEDLRADPVEALRPVFEWLGVASDERALETVRVVSQQQVSEMGAVPTPARRRFPSLGPAVLASRARGGLRRLRGRITSTEHASQEDGAVAFRFVRAMRERDADALGALTASNLELEVHDGDGDLTLRGDDARETLAKLAGEAFGRRYFSERWVAVSGASEWWAAAPGKQFSGLFMSALGGDAKRVDLSLCLAIDGELVRRVTVIAAGPLSGRSVVPDEAGTVAP